VGHAIDRRSADCVAIFLLGFSLLRGCPAVFRKAQG
jgi:hypothetical protein